jgi:threonine synthase
MRYVSTRGDAPPTDFAGVLTSGLAPDGGLYVPVEWPVLGADDLRSFAGRPYAEVAATVMWPFVTGSSIGRDAFDRLVADAYVSFDHPQVVPLRRLHDGVQLLELFWGPTLSFKDVALQLVGRLLEHELARTGGRITVLGATSGDTGSAAIEGCRDRAGIELWMLHPYGRVSEVQRRQMTTVMAANIHNLAVEGTFDDCQDLVKAAFADRPFRARMQLGAVNSINWARVAAQVVYYVTAAVALGAPDRQVSFSVPTGNFGNVLAADVARRMGVPIAQLIIASNENDILIRTVETGTMSIEDVQPTTSPAMDIQVSSNFERLLFDLYDGNGLALGEDMVEFRASGRLTLAPAVHRALCQRFDAGRLTQPEVLDLIAAQYRADGTLVEPHTAVGLGVGRRLRRDPDVPLVALACAHPAKFGDTVRAATGVEPPLPQQLADLAERAERYGRVPADLAAVQAEMLAPMLAGHDVPRDRPGL